MKIMVRKDLKGLKEMHTRVMQVVPQGIMKSTSYDGASLRSPILEKGVMLGVLPDSDDGT